MNDSKISVRYSRALFQLALEKNSLDAVYADMELISELCRIPEMKELLESPIVVPSKKMRIFGAVLGDKIQKITLSLIELVIKNGREANLSAISRRFLSETKVYKGITESTITTAVKLDEKMVKEVEAFISNTFKTKVDLKQNIDKDIIGGFILRVDDAYVDASVKSKLRVIKKELKEATYSA